MSGAEVKLLGPADLRPLVEDIVRRMPDAVNPVRGDGVCLYTDPCDSEHHCIVGQLAAEQGWTLPDLGSGANDEGAWMVARRMGWPVTAEGRDWLLCVQSEADSASVAGDPWSEIEIPEVHP